MGKRLFCIRNDLSVKRVPRTTDEVLKCTNFAMKPTEYAKYVLQRLENFTKEKNKLLKESNLFYKYNCMEHLETPPSFHISQLGTDFSEHFVQKAPVVIPDQIVAKLLKYKKTLIRKDVLSIPDEKGHERFIELFYYGIMLNNKYYTFCVRHYVKIIEGLPSTSFNVGIYLLMDGKLPVELSRYDSTTKTEHYRRFDDKGKPTRKKISLGKGEAHFQDYSEKQIVIFPYDMCHYDAKKAVKYERFQDAHNYLSARWGLERIGEPDITSRDCISNHIPQSCNNCLIKLEKKAE